MWPDKTCGNETLSGTYTRMSQECNTRKTSSRNTLGTTGRGAPLDTSHSNVVCEDCSETGTNKGRLCQPAADSPHTQTFPAMMSPQRLLIWTLQNPPPSYVPPEWPTRLARVRHQTTPEQPGCSLVAIAKIVHETAGRPCPSLLTVVVFTTIALALSPQSRDYSVAVEDGDAQTVRFSESVVFEARRKSLKLEDLKLCHVPLWQLQVLGLRPRGRTSSSALKCPTTEIEPPFAQTTTVGPSTKMAVTSC
eukprot:Em0018g19a